MKLATIHIATAFLFVCHCANTAMADDYLSYDFPAGVFKSEEFFGRDLGVVFYQFYTPGAKPSLESKIGTEYFTNGILTKKILYKEGKLHGVQRTWFLSGALHAEEPYRNGVMHGYFRVWSEAGALVGAYRMSEGSGRARIYNNEGVLVSDEKYVNGRVEGLRMSFDAETGIRSALIPVQNAVSGWSYSRTRDGHWRTITARADSGALQGPAVTFFGDGDLIEKNWYCKNKKVPEAQYKADAERDKSLPPYFADVHEYLRMADDAAGPIFRMYEEMKAVKIPIELDQNEEPLQKP